MGHSKASPEREVHSDTGLPQKNRNISNEQPNTTPTRTRGTTNKDSPEQVQGRKQPRSEQN